MRVKTMNRKEDLINEEIFYALDKVWNNQKVIYTDIKKDKRCFNNPKEAHEMIDINFSHFFCKKDPGEVLEPWESKDKRKVYLFLTSEGKKAYDLMRELKRLENDREC